MKAFEKLQNMENIGLIMWLSWSNIELVLLGIIDYILYVVNCTDRAIIAII